MARDSAARQFYIGPTMSMFSPEKQFGHGTDPLPIVRIVKTLFLPEKES